MWETTQFLQPHAALAWHTLGASALRGFLMTMSLVVAIGAQNAFVLRQSLQRSHVGAMVLTCAGSDLLLISSGVLGLSSLIAQTPWLSTLLALVGAAFLTIYGLQALRRSRTPSALAVTTARSTPLTLQQTLMRLAAFTYLNPHVYLDTVLLGALGSQQPGVAARAAFVMGATSASALWFVSLGYGARLLAPLFERPRAWQALDMLVGLTMLLLASQLAGQVEWAGVI